MKRVGLSKYMYVRLNNISVYFARNSIFFFRKGLRVPVLKITAGPSQIQGARTHTHTHFYVEVSNLGGHLENLKANVPAGNSSLVFNCVRFNEGPPHIR